jgi:ABC-type polysaccharide/polyol phosphate transport system ATPase subunit
MSDVAVDVVELSKRFRLYDRPWHRAADWFSLGGQGRHTDFWALRDVSFRLHRGEALGIIGPNGAGKSTLLKILSRALHPTSGRFDVRGRAMSLLELGTGFNPQLTGIENIRNSARLYGFGEQYIRSRLADIVAFSELGEFIDRPIRIYSSGMYVRLAFSMFAYLEPDVYIIDEALAVGDAAFQKKCVDRLNEMRRNGVTILFVSHDLWRVEALCNRAIYLSGGAVRACAAPDAVVRTYLEEVENRAARAAAERAVSAAVAGAGAGSEPAPGAPSHAPGLVPQFEMYTDSPLRIRRLWVAGIDGEPRAEFGLDEEFQVGLEYECRERVGQPVFRVVFGLPDERRVAVAGWHPGAAVPIEPGRGVLRWRIAGGVLFPRRYVLHTSVSTPDGVVYDTHYAAAGLRVGAEGLGPVIRLTDDLAACLRYSVEHDR